MANDNDNTSKEKTEEIKSDTEKKSDVAEKKEESVGTDQKQSENAKEETSNETTDVNQNLKNVQLNDDAGGSMDDDEDLILSSISKSSDEIESQITNLIATGHMFKAHVIAKKAFQKHPDNVNIAQAYALVLLKTGALEESRKLIYPILGVTPVLDESTGLEMCSVPHCREAAYKLECKDKEAFWDRYYMAAPGRQRRCV